MELLKDLTGQRFGRLTVLSRAENYTSPSGKTTKVVYNCVCDCGIEVSIKAQNLVSGSTKSCGCLQVEFAQRGTHHLSGTRFESIYYGMIARCYYQANDNYKYYGEKGIMVCDDWLSFDGFIKDMLASYEDGMSLERKDPKGNYEKSNCKWIPIAAQALNRSSTRWLTYKGETLPLTEMARKYNIPFKRLWQRLDKGWSISDSIERPSQYSRNG